MKPLPLLLICLASPVAALAVDQVVVVGQQELVKVDYPIGRSAIGDAEICHYRILENRREVLLTGGRMGETTLTLWDQANVLRDELFIRVRPSSGDANQIIDELRELLGGIEGVRFRAVGQTVWIEGEVLTERDLTRVDKVLAGYPEVRSLVELSSVTQQMLDQAAAESISTVQLDVTIVEIDKSYRRNLGIRWAGEYTPDSALPFEGTDIGPMTGVVENILPQLNVLTQTGRARVLANPTLITQSGDRAHIFVGGEIPIPISLPAGGVAIEYKEYGVKMEFEPIVDTQRNIATAVFVELSSLGGVTVKGVPGLITNRVDTSVFVKEGQSITLGGLVQSREAEHIDKIPGLGNIPILGHLFKSKLFRQEVTDMLVFATPKVVDNEQAGTKVKEEILADFEEFEEIRPKKEKKKKN